MEKKNEVKSGKKGLWAVFKDSMNKANSGCGPGCSCHFEKRDNKELQKDIPQIAGKGKEQK